MPARDDVPPTVTGVDPAAAKDHLYSVARRLGIPGRSAMTKGELIEAIEKASEADRCPAG